MTRAGWGGRARTAAFDLDADDVALPFPALPAPRPR